MKNMLLRRRIMLGLASSPFSPEATAILKEDFPNEWDDIKAYGYTNREMVPYINEDPYVVISLGLVSDVIRYLVGNSNCYINTNYIPNNKTDFETIQIFRAVSNNMYWGVRDVNQGGNGFTMQIVNGNFRFDNGTMNNLEAAQKDTLVKTIKSETRIIINQTSHNITAFSGTIITPLVIMGAYNAGICSGRLVDYLYFKIIEEGTVLYNFIPFTHNNSNGMIDILTGTFYPNAADSGAFTIEFSGRPYLNITSTTKTYIINTYGESAWNTVKEFFTNPDNEYLVKYVNNDPDIICSLVDIGYKRFLVGDGFAYIDTQYIPKSTTKIKVVSIITESNQTVSAVVGITNSITNLFGISSTATQNAYATFSFGQNNQTPTTKFTIKPELSSVIQFNKEYIIEINSESASMKDNNGNIVFSHNFDGNGLLSLNYTLPIFAFNNDSNTPSKISSVKVSNETLYENDNIVKNFIPCKNINGSDYGMLDITNDIFYPNANSSGTFTISIEQNS